MASPCGFVASPYDYVASLCDFVVTLCDFVVYILIFWNHWKVWDELGIEQVLLHGTKFSGKP